MSVCNKCGNHIEFRYVNGRCIPLHLDGSCIDGGWSYAFDYSGYNVSQESACFSTHCPKCNDVVFFIRHNGGSVWIDPPLGPPWIKHTCFEPESSEKTSLACEYKINFEQIERKNRSIKIGVIKSTKVNWKKTFTLALMDIGHKDPMKIFIKFNAGFLIGKLCLYDQVNNNMWPIDEPEYIFETYISAKSTEHKIIECPECEVKINSKNLKRHLQKHYKYS